MWLYKQQWSLKLWEKTSKLITIEFNINTSVELICIINDALGCNYAEHLCLHRKQFLMVRGLVFRAFICHPSPDTLGISIS